MEITHPDGDPSSAWYVTNGLLPVELITGRLQVGDSVFEQRASAQINVAGDSDDQSTATYATFTNLLNVAPLPVGVDIGWLIDREGHVTTVPEAFEHLAQVVFIDPITNHSVAAPFSSGIVSDLAARGRPITEPYWTAVRVAGTPQTVLIQCFERRCLTYTPDNSEGWQVEAGNVGQHYYAWRYAGVKAHVIAPALTNHLEVILDGNIAQRDVDLLVAGITAADAYLKTSIGVDVDVTVELRIFAGDVCDGARARGGIEGSKGVITVCLGNDGWIGHPELEKLRVASHEYVHVFQHRYVSGCNGPVWIHEGIAEYYSYKTLDLFDYQDFQASMEISKYRATHSNPDLPNLEDIVPNQPGWTYDLYFLAIEFLMENMADTMIAQYCQGVGSSGENWESVFADMFGMTVEQFYVEFDEYRSEW